MPSDEDKTVLAQQGQQSDNDSNESSESSDFQAGAHGEAFETPQPRLPDIPNYRLLAHIGEGGMGAVYRGQHLTLQRTVAIKLLKTEAYHSSDLKQRFLREAQSAAGLRHPRVVQIYDAGEVDGCLFMAFDYLPHGDLTSLVRADFPVAESITLMRDATEGLVAIEQAGLIHRDIKPSNIFLDEEQRAVIGDLGLARTVSQDDRLTETGRVVGTPAFMAPEQLSGDADLDIRCDLYALGATWYYLLAGEAPYAASTQYALAHKVLSAPVPDIRSIRPDVPLKVAKLITCLLAKGKVQRPASAAALLSELQGCSGPQLNQPTNRVKWPVPISAIVVLAASAALLLPNKPDASNSTTPTATAAASGPAEPAEPASQAAETVSPAKPRPVSEDPGQPEPQAPSKLHLAASQAPWSNSVFEDQYGIAATMVFNDIKLTFRYISSGTFIMGSPSNEPGHEGDERQISVMLSRPYWIMDREVSQLLYGSVTGENPSSFVSPQHPVEMVSYKDAMTFMALFNLESIHLNARLPSEAEWEYACRAGSTGMYGTGPAIADQAWFQQEQGTRPIASGQANAWGLHDMHGNVWEWCADGWTGQARQHDLIDPLSISGSERACRGGSWSSSPTGIRAANRNGRPIDAQYSSLGFRLVIPILPRL